MLILALIIGIVLASAFWAYVYFKAQKTWKKTYNSLYTQFRDQIQDNNQVWINYSAGLQQELVEEKQKTDPNFELGGPTRTVH